ncbi:hypothetical protein K3148_06130 [Qipengyuania aurantiaca]|uniref:Alpha/beta hydrolase n=1 Tax=Qipengyuania aurantiaca TaxID=2867233 RepID=A0ABX8ZT56_9SPHN|nr:alpha/beta hydrolase-fold protein [Qipengyuania aurantiaca]QZD90959.1 hypothetical protein K3148_06130 [Qipengyuania aurantiaca]
MSPLTLFRNAGLAVAALAATGLATPAAANPQLAYIEGARASMERLEPRQFQADDMPYEHTVSIALPASYHAQPEATYPVVWVMDNALMTRSVVAMVDLLVSGNDMPEVIVIGVGSDETEGLAGVQRRYMDFSPPVGGNFLPDGLNGKVWDEDVGALPEMPQLADKYLAFLVDQLRPALCGELRCGESHTIHGHSAGGMFAAYALLERPGAFDRAILGSPFMRANGGAVLDREEAFAESGQSLPTDLYIGVGGAEADEWFPAVAGIVPGTAEFANRLTLRGYEGLTLKTRFYDGEDHYTVAPRVIMDGLKYLFREEAAAIGSSWPQRPE